MTETRLLLGGLTFPEGPRWHDGGLWFSDIQNRRIQTVTREGAATVVVADHGPKPSGIGFLPDGTPIFSSMDDKLLMRIGDGGLDVHADLSAMPGDFINDMIVDSEGRAYVGTRTRGMSPWDPGEASDSLVLVEPDGAARVVADGLTAPNGLILSADLSTVIVAETYGHRLVAFACDTDGSLSDRRVFAEVETVFPDGICLDAQGGVWIGSPYTDEFVRVLEGGEITHRIAQPGAVACVLGGEGRQTLFLMCVDPGSMKAHDAAPGTFDGGSIRMMGAPYPGSGTP